MSRFRSVPLLVLLAVLPSPPVAARDSARRPDILLIVADTWRADALSCAAGGDTTPNLDRLAAEGVLFEDAVTAAVFTATSVASLLTGLYPAVHGVHLDTDGFSVLPSSFVTLAEILRSAGYRTSAYTNFSFDAWGIAQGFDEVRVLGSSLADVGPAAVLLMEDDDPRPTFLLLHFYDVHHPYVPPDEDVRYDGPFVAMNEEEAVMALEALSRSPPETATASMHESVQRLHASMLTTSYSQKTIDRHHDLFNPPAGSASHRWASFLNRWAATHLDHESLRYVRARYMGEVRRTDRLLGELFDRLRSSGRLEHLVVAFVSDHGEGLGERGEFFHGHSLGETMLRVPMILHLPSPLPRGCRVREQVRSIDLFPTLLEAAGLPAPDRIQGRSLMPLLRGEPETARVALTETPKEYSLRAAPWKFLALRDGGRPRLFDVRPAENRFYGEQRARDADIERTLARTREALLRESARLRALWVGVSPAARRYPPAMEKELKELGYLR